MTNEQFSQDQPQEQQMLLNGFNNALIEGTQLTSSRLRAIETEFESGLAVHGLSQLKMICEEGQTTARTLMHALEEVGTSYYDANMASGLGRRLEDSLYGYNSAYSTIREGYEQAHASSGSALIEAESMDGEVSSISTQLISYESAQELLPSEIDTSTVDESHPDDENQPSDNQETNSGNQLEMNQVTEKVEEATSSMRRLNEDVGEIRYAISKAKNSVEELPMPHQLQGQVEELNNALRMINLGNTYYAQEAQHYVGSILSMLRQVDESVESLGPKQAMIRDNISNTISALKRIESLAL